MFALDGEELWYADFINKRGVYTQPPFVDHVSYVEEVYESAVADLQVCRDSLKLRRKAIKDPLENGKEKLILCLFNCLSCLN